MTQNINQLAVNTIRTLSLMLLMRQIQVIQVFRWAQRQWLMHYGRII